MKGVVFTEFFDLVEESFSLEVADKIIQKSKLENDGAYTAVGTYDYCEMVTLVTHLAEETDLPVPELLRIFGRHLFTRFHAGYPVFFEGVETAIDFLHKIENVIHVEVRKLYPDAELPTFEYEHVAPDEMRMVYRSARPFTEFAHGLVEGCVAHFGDKHDIAREDLDVESGSAARFVVTSKV
jgi:hypothetical protein